MEGAGHRHGQEAKQSKGRRRRAKDGTSFAPRPEEGRSAGGSGRRGRSQEDATAETPDGWDLADGDGNGGKDARREGTFRRHERDRLGYAGDARLDHRGAAQA